MRSVRVTVVPYNAAWKSEFEKIRDEIKAALEDTCDAIEHVGSTSVEGMMAKPCIDIDVVIADSSLLCEVVRRLGGIGYIHEGDLGIKGREAFKYSGKEHLMAHHLYVCTRDSAELYRHLSFRDFLCKSPEAVLKYSRIKEQAARLYPDDIDKYIEFKSPCIRELYAMCGLDEKE